MTNPNSSAQRSFAAEPYDSVAEVLASKQITASLEGETLQTKRGAAISVLASSAVAYHFETEGGGKINIDPTLGVIMLSDFGIGSDPAADVTDLLQKAVLAASGAVLDWSGCAGRITGNIVLPDAVTIRGKASWVLDGDVDAWFSGIAGGIYSIEHFEHTMPVAFVSRTKLNRAIVLTAPEFARIGNLVSDGASTIAQAVGGNTFIVDSVKASGIQGQDAQYGYGINSSARNTIVNHVDVDGEGEGRHFFYINGGTWEYARLGGGRFKNWARNPVQVANTGTGSCFIEIGSFDHDNCNFNPISNFDGCINFADGSSPLLRARVAKQAGRNLKGAMLCAKYTGTDALDFEGAEVEELQAATVSATSLVYLRGGKDQRVGPLIVRGDIPTNWQYVLSVRDATNLNFDAIEALGSATDSAARLLNVRDSSVRVGDLHTASIGKINTGGGGAVLSYKALQQRVVYGTAAPSSGTWSAGDICWNTSPGANGPVGWVFTSTSAWLPFGGRASSRSDSTATDIAGVNTVINDLLAKMRTAGLLAT